MKNITSEFDFCADALLKRSTDNAMIIGSRLPISVDQSLNNNNNNNNEDDIGNVHASQDVTESQSNKDKPSALDPRYFYSVGHRRRPAWLTSSSEDLDKTLCRTCHPRMKTTSSASLEDNQEIKSLVNGVNDNDVQKLCILNGFAEDASKVSPRMVRSVSLGVDLPTKTNASSKDSSNERLRDLCRCNVGINGDSAVASPVSSASLSAVLESIPLSYDPQTKKLHVIGTKSTPLRPEICVGHPFGRNGTEFQSACTETSASLNRVTTSGSLPSGAECSSFSSVSSLSTDFSSALDDAITCTDTGQTLNTLNSDSSFIEINFDRRRYNSSGLQSIESSEASSLDDCLAVSQGAKPKRRGITGFLSRNFLPWKFTPRDQSAITTSDEDGEHQTSSNWKFFSGRTKDTGVRSIDEYHLVNNYNSSVHSNTTSPQRTQTNRTISSDSSSSSSSTPRRRKGDNLSVTSTTALILENRPLNLPAKDPEEELKHRLQYEQMVEDAKRRELKEVKMRKKHFQQQLKHEERLSLASKIWNVEILNNWDSMRNSRKTKELWWQGIPPNVRGRVWMLAIGNDLHITPELYEICVCRAKDRIRMAAESISVSEDVDVEVMTDKEGSVELIKLDVSRTFPQLCIFQKGGPYYDLLHSLLGAYVCYRPDVGYVQGMSFLAAVLILNLDVADAFVCFANLLNQPCQLAFFRLDEPMMRSYFLTYEEFFRENMPDLFEHFSALNLSPDLYLIDWIYTLYSRSLPLDVASRVWDVFFRDGDEFLFRTALGILRQYEDLLMRLDFIHVAQFLTKLPEDMAGEPLFKCIESIRMVSDKRTFAQVLAGHYDNKQT